MFHGVAEWTSNILELSKTFFTDKITKETIELNCSVQPYFNQGRIVSIRKITESQQTKTR